MKYILSIAIISLLPLTLLGEDEQRTGIATNIMNGAANTDKNVVDVVSSGKEVDMGKREVKKEKKIWHKKSWRKEKIYKQLYQGKSSSNKFAIQSGDGSGLFVNPQILAKNQQEIDTYKLDTEAKETLNQRLLQSLKGDCIVPFRVDIAVEPKQIKLTCKVEEDNSFIDLIVHLVPSNRSFSLVAVPKYYVNSEKEVIPIDRERSYITNFADTTSNIATYVNTQEVKKSMTYLAQGVGLGISRSANRYLDERATANREQKVVVSEGIHPIVTQSSQSKAPSVKEYTIAGLVGGLFDGIGRIASNMEGDFPYLYRIEEGSLINFFITPLIVNQNRSQRDENENGRMK